MEHDIVCRVSGLRKRILQEAENTTVPPEDYYKAYVDNIFQEMDVNKDGTISLEELVKPNSSDWIDFLRFISVRVINKYFCFFLLMI